MSQNQEVGTGSTQVPANSSLGASNVETTAVVQQTPGQLLRSRLRRVFAERLQVEVNQLADRDLVALATGNIGVLSPDLQHLYLEYLANKVGVDPTRNPFILISTKEGAVKVYATKECAEMLAANHKVHIELVAEEMTSEYCRVVLRFRLPDGRETVNSSCGFWGSVMGRDRDNIYKRTWSQALRRGVQAITGCGFSDVEDAAPGAAALAQPVQRAVPPGEPQQLGPPR